MKEIERPVAVLRSGIYDWKEVLVRTLDSQFISTNEVEEEMIEVPLLIHDKAGYLQPGIVKEYVLQKIRIGELIGYREPGTTKIHIGFSLVHPIDKNDYQKEFGVSLAVTIADNSYLSVPAVPAKAREAIAYFTDRCLRYWKGSTVPNWCLDLKRMYVD